ncbi:MAG: TolC family outer membrane protein [Candidatus Thiodiazotropha sp.]|nr:TolC family outer membrane protein [Candidatus Thiodiazotropha sp.]MCM8885693.1 TolC family outer membrane protein [Candidatus Thiodiazotropha sp.]MCM8922335.1 TolC family outer membrane protein [Candidatus Thiodiazotropha sp.]
MVIDFLFKATVVAVGFAITGSSYALNLRTVVENAINTNPEVLVQSSQHLSRLEELDQARSGYLPSIDLTAAAGYERTDNSSTRASGDDGRSLTRKEANLTLRQMLFDGFATQGEVERQNARTKAQKKILEGASENLGLKAVETYVQVLLHKKLMALSSENLTAHARIYDQVELRSNSGVGSSSDLAQIRGRRSSASSNMLSDEVNLKDAETNFLRIVGLLPESLEAVGGVIDKIPSTQDEAIRIALENHPTLMSADADIAAAMAQQKASKSAHLPRLDLELGARYGDDLDGVEGRDDDVTAMLRMRYNLFAGGKDRARNRQTAHLVNEAKEVRNSTYRQVVESMRLSWTAYQVTNKQLSYLEDHVVASEKTRDAYAKQFNLGKRSLLDLLDSENEVYEAKREKTKTWYDHQFSQYRILVGMNMLKAHLGIDFSGSDRDGDKLHQAYVDIADKSTVEAEVAPLRSVLEQPVSLKP